ncbi:MAG: cytochrome c biogenesis protein CcdA [Thermoplasmata archaeon]
MSKARLIMRGLLIIFVITLLIPFSMAGAESTIRSVIHYPENPFSGEEISVFVQVNSTDNITSVSMIHCEIEPLGPCSLPIQMILGENNTYSANISGPREGITKIGYNITITFIDGSEEYSPIGDHYHYVNVTESQGGVTPPSPTEGSLAIQVLIIILIVILVFLTITHIKREDKSQPMNKKVLGAIIIVVCIIISVISFYVIYAGQVSLAPDFSLTDIDGETFSLSDYRGKVVVLDLMALDCSSCKIVERNLEDIWAEYGDEIEIISISVWPDRDSVEDLRNHRDKENITWRIARDTDDLISKYGATEIAKVMIINGDGYVVFEKVGVSETDEMSEVIGKAIKGEAEVVSISSVGIWALAFGAGVASFFSPCSFPLLPGYIGYYLGIEKSRDELSTKTIKKALPGGIVSALGILFIYIIVGVILILVGSTTDLDIAILAPIIGIILIALGALMLTNVQYYFIINPIKNFFSKLTIKKKKAEVQSPTQEGLSKKSLGGLFVFGIGYGAASAGCTLPIFGVIVLGALMQNDILNGIILLLLYGLGAAIFMVITTLLVSASEDTILNKLKVSTDLIKKISGGLMIVGGIGVITFYYIAMGG